MDFDAQDLMSYGRLIGVMLRNPLKSWRGFTSVYVVRANGGKARLNAVDEDRAGHYIQKASGRGARPKVTGNFVSVVGMTLSRYDDIVGIKLNYRGGSLIFPYSPTGRGKVHHWAAALGLATTAEQVKPGLTLAAQVTFTA